MAFEIPHKATKFDYKQPPWMALVTKMKLEEYSKLIECLKKTDKN